jgi:hypothetical protein
MTQKMKALVLEQNKPMRTQMVQSLRELDLDVDEAGSFMDGFHKVKEGGYDLFISTTSVNGEELNNNRGCALGRLFKYRNPRGYVVAMSSSRQALDSWDGLADKETMAPYYKPETIKPIVQDVLRRRSRSAMEDTILVPRIITA